ncbi:unnamed protein product [Adineta steineri]|nr:unnamed protein product [Adineta steineri]
MAKSQRTSVHDDSMPLGLSNNGSNHISTINDFENMNDDDDSHVQQLQPPHHPQHQHQHKPTVPIVDGDYYDTSNSLLDPQMAAYRAIMSRMVPFANNVNGNNSPKRLVKQEPYHNQDDDSSHGDESNSSSPLNDHLSP